MTDFTEKTIRPVQKTSWIMLTAVGLLATLSALYVAFTPAGSQTELTTQSWEAFATANQEVATLFEMQLVLAGLSAAGYSFFGTLVAWNAYKKGRKWAWFAMWLFPIVYGGAAVRMLIDQYGVGYMYAGFAAISVAALLMPIRRFF